MSIGENKLLPILGENTLPGPLTRREMARRLLATMSASALWPLLSKSHPICEHLQNDFVLYTTENLLGDTWKPVFLSAQQNESLISLAETILPGSRNAQVNRFIDLLFSVDEPGMQRLLVESLTAFENEARARFEKDIPSLDDDQKYALLTDASKNPPSNSGRDPSAKETRSLQEHFENLKAWVSVAYYSSEAGLRELGWTGDYVFERFPGCEHPEGHR